MWGEIAFQVDPSVFNRLVIDSDSNGVAPGNAIFRQVLEAASPCLILIDELVSYLVKLRFSNARRSQNLYRQTVQFLQEMFQLAGNTAGVCVLISLPQSRTEFGGLDPEHLQRELAIVPDLQARADRVVSKRTPVNDDEIYTLMSKRLFKRADLEAASFAARMYQEAYERTRAVYDPTVFSADYIEQQVNAYPLHPELIDVLYKKWSTATDFPRTRTVLQLLANIVADQWVNRREAYAIHSSHVDLSRERIRTKVVSAAGAGGGYDAVVAADIIGGDAHADAQDEQRGAEYQRHHVARGVATTLLMHSFGGLNRSGALPQELRLGTVAPNVGPEYVSEVVESLEQSLWYVHREGELLRFQTRPNIYRVISQTADTQPAATVAEHLREAAATAMGTQSGFRVLQWAAADGVIADNPEPSVAVLHPRYAVWKENGDVPLVGRDKIDQLWERVGGGLRQWRNSLILVAPDRDHWSRAEEAMREVMAYGSVLADAEAGSIELSALETKDLGSRAKEKEASLRSSITTAYCWVFYPDEQGLAVIPLPVPATASERIVSRTVKRLSDQDYGHPKVMDQLGAVYFNSRLKPQLWKDDSTPADIEEMSRRFPQWTYLPILPTREETLRACIREGIKDRLWAVVVGDNATSTYQQLIETPEELDATPILFDGSASLVTGDLLEIIGEELQSKASSVTSPPSVEGTVPAEDEKQGEPAEPASVSATERHRVVRLRISSIDVGKTGNLQPYLFKAIQDQDAGAELAITIEVRSEAGITVDLLDDRIVQGLEQLGIGIDWDATIE